MKKSYNTPEMLVVNVETNDIIADSSVYYEGSNTGGGPTKAESPSQRDSDWENW